MGRRRILVDREIQFRSVLYVLLFMVLTSIFVSLATFNSVWSLLVNYLAAANEKNLTHIFDVTFRTFAVRITLLTIFLAVLATLGMLLVSHRIAGPVFRIRQILKELQEGKSPVFTLRKGDSLSALMDEIRNFGLTYIHLVQASKRVLEIWNKTQVQDMSLNLALKDLEECFQEKIKEENLTVEKKLKEEGT
ncbi:MAG TPA: hypothetical protein PK165_04930 [bacterium]|nr:hypothetical protein [bacterium]HOL49747.1 hypothetical protein [bacterium]HPO52154.1 hypothetical protein [bacterium]HXK44635.1 hypothetical protein [bacterium]